MVAVVLEEREVDEEGSNTAPCVVAVREREGAPSVEENTGGGGAIFSESFVDVTLDWEK